MLTPRFRGTYAEPLNPQFATEGSGSVVGFGAVVVGEDAAEAIVAEDGAAEGSDVSGRFEPA